MSRSAGNIATFISGARVSGEMRYTPAHYSPENNGRVIQACIKIPVAINGKKNPKTGIAPAIFITLEAWGGLADYCARQLSPGRALDCEADVNTYNSNMYFKGTNTQIMNPDGTPYTTTKTTYKIRIGTLRVGEESAELVQEEIRKGIRGLYWEWKSDPAYAAHRDRIAKRKSIYPEAGKEKFCFAKVYAKGLNLVPLAVLLSLDKKQAGTSQDMVQKVGSIANDLPAGNFPPPPGAYVPPQQQSMAAGVGPVVDTNDDDIPF